MKTEGKRHTVTSLAALLVFTVFTLCALLVLLTGAKIYRGVTDRSQNRADAATAARYITTRIHQADAAGALSLEPFGDGEALVIHSAVDQDAYETRIYCHNGWLCELFSAKAAGLSPEDGEQILPLHAFSVSRQGQGLHITLQDNTGAEQALFLALRAQQEEAP